jgi:hypothetical protein
MFVSNSGHMMQKYAKYPKELEPVMIAARRFFT